MEREFPGEERGLPREGDNPRPGGDEPEESSAGESTHSDRPGEVEEGLKSEGDNPRPGDE